MVEECFARLLDKKSYKAIVQRLKDAGFQMLETGETIQVNDAGALVFAALSKDDDTWICRLNKDYFVE